MARGDGSSPGSRPGRSRPGPCSTFPGALAGALALLVARGASRYFRQNGHPLVTAARWTVEGTPPLRGVRAVATDEALAAAVLRGAERAGCWLDDLVPGAAPDGGFSLLPLAERARRRRAGWARAGWLAAVGAASASSRSLSAGRLVARARVVEADLARLAAPRAALLAARRSLDSAAALVAALEHSSARRGVVLDRLIAVARGLPDVHRPPRARARRGRAGRPDRPRRPCHHRGPGPRPRHHAGPATTHPPKPPATPPSAPSGERFIIRLGPEPAP
ncbi:MAG: hypothetical protein IPG75_17370 [Gemmatimonadetes bacterium]|nr:hypothetical protein [Gemmatimonadota bacterium]